MAWNICSAATAGSTMSPVVTAAGRPNWLNRSPHSSVPVVSSNSTWASHPWGTCGVEICRTRLPPRSITSPSAERPGRPVAEVVERHVAPQRAVGDLAVRRRRQPHVHRPALVGLDVAERDPPQRLDRHDRGDGLGDEREQPAHAGVEQQRLLAGEQELVEREAVRRHVRDPGGEAVDPVGDLVDVGGWHGLTSSPCSHWRSTDARSVHLALNDPSQLARSRGVRAVGAGADVSIERRTGLRQRIRQLGDRRPQRAGDVEPRPLGHRAGSSRPAAQPEGVGELGRRAGRARPASPRRPPSGPRPARPRRRPAAARSGGGRRCAPPRRATARHRRRPGGRCRPRRLRRGRRGRARGVRRPGWRSARPGTPGPWCPGGGRSPRRTSPSTTSRRRPARPSASARDAGRTAPRLANRSTSPDPSTTSSSASAACAADASATAPARSPQRSRCRASSMSKRGPEPRQPVGIERVDRALEQRQRIGVAPAGGQRPGLRRRRPPGQRWNGDPIGVRRELGTRRGRRLEVSGGELDVDQRREQLDRPQLVRRRRPAGRGGPSPGPGRGHLGRGAGGPPAAAPGSTGPCRSAAARRRCTDPGARAGRRGRCPGASWALRSRTRTAAWTAAARPRPRSTGRARSAAWHGRCRNGRR